MLLFAAAMPGIAALGLRVYENALVRRTEAEISAEAGGHDVVETKAGVGYRLGMCAGSTKFGD